MGTPASNKLSTPSLASAVGILNVCVTVLNKDSGLLLLCIKVFFKSPKMLSATKSTASDLDILSLAILSVTILEYSSDLGMTFSLKYFVAFFKNSSFGSNALFFIAENVCFK